MATILDQQYQSDVNPITPMPTDRVDDTSTVNTSTAETIVWYYSNSGVLTAASGQAAGTICCAKTTYTGITNALGSSIGNYYDTSLSFSAATRADTLVKVPEEAFSKMESMSLANKVIYIATWLTTNGYYAVDSRRGVIWLKTKADPTNDSATYKYQSTLSGGGAGDKVDLIKYNGTAVSSTNPIFVKEVSSGTDVVVLNATGAAALNATTAIAAEFRLLAVTVHFSSAPTTSENLVVKLDSIAGAAYDTTLSTTNPSLSAATDVVFEPSSELKFKTGDEIVVTFTNTDTRTYGLSIYYQLI